jgi:hypothetical protein
LANNSRLKNEDDLDRKKSEPFPQTPLEHWDFAVSVEARVDAQYRSVQVPSRQFDRPKGGEILHLPNSTEKSF